MCEGTFLGLFIILLHRFEPVVNTPFVYTLKIIVLAFQGFLAGIFAALFLFYLFFLTLD